MKAQVAVVAGVVVLVLVYLILVSVYGNSFSQAEADAVLGNFSANQI